jgi:hypothetical protein
MSTQMPSFTQHSPKDFFNVKEQKFLIGAAGFTLLSGGSFMGALFVSATISKISLACASIFSALCAITSCIAHAAKLSSHKYHELKNTAFKHQIH